MPVSVVSYDATELGRQGAELLLRGFRGDRSEPRHVVLPTTVIPRGSGELTPA